MVHSRQFDVADFPTVFVSVSHTVIANTNYVLFMNVFECQCMRTLRQRKFVKRKNDDASARRVLDNDRAEGVFSVYFTWRTFTDSFQGTGEYCPGTVHL